MELTIVCPFLNRSNATISISICSLLIKSLPPRILEVHVMLFSKMSTMWIISTLMQPFERNYAHAWDCVHIEKNCLLFKELCPWICLKNWVLVIVWGNFMSMEELSFLWFLFVFSLVLLVCGYSLGFKYFYVIIAS
jgi:hypothetical protein